MVQIDNLALERIQPNRNLEFFSKSSSIPENLSSKRKSEISKIKNSLRESGAVDFLMRISDELNGSKVGISTCISEGKEGKLQVSAHFFFNEKIYEPNLVDKEPWREWHKCQVFNDADSGEIKLEVLKYKDGKDPVRIFGTEFPKNEGEDEDLFKIEDRVKSLYHPNTYPNDDIEHALYDSFRSDVRAIEDIADGNHRKEVKMLNQLFDEGEYREVVKLHMPFHFESKDK